MRRISLSLVFFLLVVLGFGRAEARQVGRHARPEDLRLSARLQSPTIGDFTPLVVTLTLTNATDSRLRVPAIPTSDQLEAGHAGFLLLGADGLTTPYQVGIMKNRPYWPWDVYEVAPHDSIYWRHLLWWDGFSGSASGSFDASIGHHRMIARLGLLAAREMDSGPQDEYVTLADTVDFEVVRDSELGPSARALRPFMREFFWWDRQFIESGSPGESLRSEVRVDSYEVALQTAYAELPATYPYWAYLWPNALSQVIAREPEAIALARRFLRDHPEGALPEEMSFDLVKMLMRGGQDSDAKSLLDSLLVRYPSNGRALWFAEGREAWLRR